MLHEEHVWFGATVAQKIRYLLWLHFLHVTALANTAFYVHVFPLEIEEILRKSRVQ